MGRSSTLLWALIGIGVLGLLVYTVLKVYKSGAAEEGDGVVPPAPSKEGFQVTSDVANRLQTDIQQIPSLIYNTIYDDIGALQTDTDVLNFDPASYSGALSGTRSVGGTLQDNINNLLAQQRAGQKVVSLLDLFRQQGTMRKTVAGGLTTATDLGSSSLGTLYPTPVQGRYVRIARTPDYSRNEQLQIRQVLVFDQTGKSVTSNEGNLALGKPVTVSGTDPFSSLTIPQANVPSSITDGTLTYNGTQAWRNDISGNRTNKTAYAEIDLGEDKNISYVVVLFGYGNTIEVLDTTVTVRNSLGNNTFSSTINTINPSISTATYPTYVIPCGATSAVPAPDPSTVKGRYVRIGRTPGYSRGNYLQIQEVLVFDHSGNMTLAKDGTIPGNLAYGKPVTVSDTLSAAGIGPGSNIVDGGLSYKSGKLPWKSASTGPTAYAEIDLQKDRDIAYIVVLFDRNNWVEVLDTVISVRNSLGANVFSSTINTMTYDKNRPTVTTPTYVIPCGPTVQNFIAERALEVAVKRKEIGFAEVARCAGVTARSVRLRASNISGRSYLNSFLNFSQIQIFNANGENVALLPGTTVTASGTLSGRGPPQVAIDGATEPRGGSSILSWVSSTSGSGAFWQATLPSDQPIAYIVYMGCPEASAARNLGVLVDLLDAAGQPIAGTTKTLPTSDVVQVVPYCSEAPPTTGLIANPNLTTTAMTSDLINDYMATVPVKAAPMNTESLIQLVVPDAVAAAQQVTNTFTAVSKDLQSYAFELSKESPLNFFYDFLVKEPPTATAYVVGSLNALNRSEMVRTLDFSKRIYVDFPNEIDRYLRVDPNTLKPYMRNLSTKEYCKLDVYNTVDQGAFKLTYFPLLNSFNASMCNKQLTSQDLDFIPFHTRNFLKTWIANRRERLRGAATTPPLALSSQPSIVSSVKARYVKLRPSLTAAPDRYLSLTEIRVYDTTGRNVAYRKTVTASPGFDSIGTDPTVVVNGDLDLTPREGVIPVWQSATQDTNTVFWQVDLGAEFDITSLDYYGRYDCCTYRNQGVRIELIGADNAVKGSLTTASTDIFQRLTVDPNAVDLLPPIVEINQKSVLNDIAQAFYDFLQGSFAMTYIYDVLPLGYTMMDIRFDMVQHKDPTEINAKLASLKARYDTIANSGASLTLKEQAQADYEVKRQALLDAQDAFTYPPQTMLGRFFYTLRAGRVIINAFTLDPRAATSFFKETNGGMTVLLRKADGSYDYGGSGNINYKPITDFTRNTFPALDCTNAETLKRIMNDYQSLAAFDLSGAMKVAPTQPWTDISGVMEVAEIIGSAQVAPLQCLVKWKERILDGDKGTQQTISATTRKTVPGTALIPRTALFTYRNNTDQWYSNDIYLDPSGFKILTTDTLPACQFDPTSYKAINRDRLLGRSDDEAREDYRTIGMRDLLSPCPATNPGAYYTPDNYLAGIGSNRAAFGNDEYRILQNFKDKAISTTPQAVIPAKSVTPLASSIVLPQRRLYEDVSLDTLAGTCPIRSCSDRDVLYGLVDQYNGDKATLGNILRITKAVTANPFECHVEADMEYVAKEGGVTVPDAIKNTVVKADKMTFLVDVDPKTCTYSYVKATRGSDRIIPAVPALPLPMEYATYAREETQATLNTSVAAAQQAADEALGATKDTLTFYRGLTFVNVGKLNSLQGCPEVTCRSPSIINTFIKWFENQNWRTSRIKRILTVGTSGPLTCDFSYEVEQVQYNNGRQNGPDAAQEVGGVEGVPGTEQTFGARVTLQVAPTGKCNFSVSKVDPAIPIIDWDSASNMGLKNLFTADDFRRGAIWQENRRPPRYIDCYSNRVLNLIQSADTAIKTVNYISHTFSTDTCAASVSRLVYPKARYVLLRPPFDTGGPDRYLAISGIRVFDKGGVNRAATGTVDSTKGFVGIGTDPNVPIRISPDFMMVSNSFITGMPVWQSLTDDPNTVYWNLDLGAEYEISHIHYFGRLDCCAWRNGGVRIDLLAADGRTITRNLTTTGDALYQYVSATYQETKYRLLKFNMDEFNNPTLQQTTEMTQEVLDQYAIQYGRPDTQVPVSIGSRQPGCPPPAVVCRPANLDTSLGTQIRPNELLIYDGRQIDDVTCEVKVVDDYTAAAIQSYGDIYKRVWYTQEPSCRMSIFNTWSSPPSVPEFKTNYDTLVSLNPGSAATLTAIRDYVALNSPNRKIGAFLSYAIANDGIILYKATMGELDANGAFKTLYTSSSPAIFSVVATVNPTANMPPIVSDVSLLDSTKTTFTPIVESFQTTSQTVQVATSGTFTEFVDPTAKPIDVLQAQSGFTQIEMNVTKVRIDATGGNPPAMAPTPISWTSYPSNNYTFTDTSVSRLIDLGGSFDNAAFSTTTYNPSAGPLSLTFKVNPTLFRVTQREATMKQILFGFLATNSNAESYTNIPLLGFFFTQTSWGIQIPSAPATSQVTGSYVAGTTVFRIDLTTTTAEFFVDNVSSYTLTGTFGPLYIAGSLATLNSSVNSLQITQGSQQSIVTSRLPFPPPTKMFADRDPNTYTISQVNGNTQIYYKKSDYSFIYGLYTSFENNTPILIKPNSTFKFTFSLTDILIEWYIGFVPSSYDFSRVFHPIYPFYIYIRSTGVVEIMSNGVRLLSPRPKYNRTTIFSFELTNSLLIFKMNNVEIFRSTSLMTSLSNGFYTFFFSASLFSGINISEFLITESGNAQTPQSLSFSLNPSTKLSYLNNVLGRGLTNRATGSINTGVFSQVLQTPYQLTFSIPNASNSVLGLSKIYSTEPTADWISNLTHGFVFQSNGSGTLYKDGVATNTTFTYTPTSLLTIRFTGVNIEYLLDSTVLLRYKPETYPALSTAIQYATDTALSPALSNLALSTSTNTANTITWTQYPLSNNTYVVSQGSIRRTNNTLPLGILNAGLFSESINGAFQLIFQIPTLSKCAIGFTEKYSQQPIGWLDSLLVGPLFQADGTGVIYKDGVATNTTFTYTTSSFCTLNYNGAVLEFWVNTNRVYQTMRSSTTFPAPPLAILFAADSVLTPNISILSLFTYPTSPLGLLRLELFSGTTAISTSLYQISVGDTPVSSLTGIAPLSIQNLNTETKYTNIPPVKFIILPTDRTKALDVTGFSFMTGNTTGEDPIQWTVKGYKVGETTPTTLHTQATDATYSVRSFGRSPLYSFYGKPNIILTQHPSAGTVVSGFTDYKEGFAAGAGAKQRVVRSKAEMLEAAKKRAARSVEVVKQLKQRQGPLRQLAGYSLTAAPLQGYVRAEGEKPLVTEEDSGTVLLDTLYDAQEKLEAAAAAAAATAATAAKQPLQPQPQHPLAVAGFGNDFMRNSQQPSQLDTLFESPLLQQMGSVSGSSRPEATPLKFFRFRCVRTRDPNAAAVSLGPLTLFGADGAPLDLNRGVRASNPMGTWKGESHDLVTGDGWTDRAKAPLVLAFYEPVVITGFSWLTAAVAGEDPVRWKVEGSYNGVYWTTLHDQTMADASVPIIRGAQTRTWSLTNTAAF